MSNGRWTAEEYREYLRTGREPDRRPAASPTCCQRAPSSGVSLDEMEDADPAKHGAETTPFDRLSRRVSAYAAQEYLKKRGVTDAEVVLPEDRPKKPRKYRNEPVTVDGIRFDSKHEAAVYQELQLRVKAGELRNVLLQVPFMLPGGIKYIADFVTLTPDFRIEGVYDAKSEITRKNRVYINKKKQMKACWGIEIREV